VQTQLKGRSKEPQSSLSINQSTQVWRAGASKRPRIALITTPRFRRDNGSGLEEFLCQNIYSLCRHFEVLSTGRTHDLITKLVNRPLCSLNLAAIEKDLNVPIRVDEDLARWKEVINQGLIRKEPSISGMIEITHELVENRLDAVIHLSDWTDAVGKPDSMVLRREANVHGVPIASDMFTAEALISNWKSQIARAPNETLFRERKRPEELPLRGLSEASCDRVLALIAHDRMKLDMCCFVVKYIQQIFDNFDCILATGTTGGWLKQFVLAAGRGKHDADKIRCCLSGPYGGDVQIAAAVVKKYCRKVIFLQDPFTSHAHETDIRLFEQGALLFERAALRGIGQVKLATNIETAKAILGLES
jgi:methylglyoxal synthase